MSQTFADFTSRTFLSTDYLVGYRTATAGGEGRFLGSSIGLTLGSTSLTLGATVSTVAGLTLTSPTLTTPSLGVASATSINGLTITASTGTLTVAALKTLTVNDSVTLGTGGIVLGNSGGFTASASKVLTASNTLTLAGTDGTTMTFPSTSATIARTDAAQTFTGTQTINAQTLIGSTANYSLQVGNSATVITPAASVRAAFFSTANTNNLPTIAAIGGVGGYGAGYDFISALSDATTTYKSMAKIVADGTGPWNSTASTQDAALTFWTSLDGTLTKWMTISEAGVVTHAGATTLSAALTYGGVTLSNAVTGTGNMVLSAGPTFTGTVTIDSVLLGTAQTGSVPGSLRYNAAYGTYLQGKTGSSGDLALISNGNAVILYNPTGTNNSVFGGSITGNGQIYVNGAGNGIITAGTGNSRTLALQATSSGGTAFTAVLLNADGSVTLGSGSSGSQVLNVGNTSPSANGTGRVRLINSNTTYNWQLASNDNVAGVLEITPSTATGGSTFTTPALAAYGLGNVRVGVPGATTMTDGFLYVPSVAGTPTGVPTAITNFIPIVADRTNNKLYIYSGGAWVALN
jgi:hypothetical protein